MHKKEPIVTFWMIFPAIFVISVIAFFPLFKTFYDSFFDFGLNPRFPKEFVGFGNYIKLFNDSRFWDSLKTTVIFTVISVSLETILGLLIALVVHQNFKFRGAIRAAMLIPWAIPTAISSQMWRWMFNDQFGIISRLYEALGIIEPGTPILGRPGLALWAIIQVDVWKTTPFMALLILAGLQLIPEQLYEAAKIDGANMLQRFFEITLPQITQTIGIALIFRTLDALRVFDVVYVMTRGSVGTETLSVYNRSLLMDRAFTGTWFGYGSSLSVIIFLLISVFAVIYIKSLKLQID
ncbi:ABC transporter permease [Thermosipho melanesiensis]|uniref:Binding-protein-dependent transport systems inner membrane component n=2 Tax=Thermosipho melanesiensis TaxID=46541 RepID=A6LP03_THEM4|nr:sugar ABC transporter permease [Thermosipho melanesiensis]ABR31654.1 binding-protein-dependent transport systems inner membrane component [Thermosipho melanesiensis BI429]APT74681.1 ABC transporter permease [Thermosipho melanesiensis]OOC35179.1 ABC transporter permease [Thermosipho melanesiensis]OOC35389.1 ABC transporter permease [Thermosipho melanesiensis]OOC36640.1 ABC transporter permease [Thermosipho melanesiensis]